MTPRVRTDQPTIQTLEQTMSNAVYWARRAFDEAGFTDVQLVVTVVASSVDPDDDHTTWVAASKVPEAADPLLPRSLRLSAEDAEANVPTTRTGAHV